MKSRISRVAVLAAATALLGAGAVLASPASAAGPDAVVVAGTGAISPGLPPTCVIPVTQTVDFDGTVAVDAGPNAGLYPFHFHGTSDPGVCESAALGKGQGSLAGQVTGSVAYNRTANVVTISGGPLTYNGSSHSIVTASCVFYPVPGVLITTYALTCTAALN